MVATSLACVRSSSRPRDSCPSPGRVMWSGQAGAYRAVVAHSFGVFQLVELFEITRRLWERLHLDVVEDECR